MPDTWRPDINDTRVAGSRPAGVSNQERQHMIAALLRERESCERRGLEERVKLIDAELARYGHEAAKPVERAARRPGRPPRVERREEPAGE